MWHRVGTSARDSTLDWEIHRLLHTWHERVNEACRYLAGTRFATRFCRFACSRALHFPPPWTTSVRPSRPPHPRIRMFTFSVLRPAGALAVVHPSRPARSVRVNAACARETPPVSGAHSAARCVSALFAPSDARLPVMALRAGRSHRRARRAVSARAEGSSGAQYGEVRPVPWVQKAKVPLGKTDDARLHV